MIRHVFDGGSVYFELLTSIEGTTAQNVIITLLPLFNARINQFLVGVNCAHNASPTQKLKFWLSGRPVGMRIKLFFSHRTSGQQVTQI